MRAPSNYASEWDDDAAAPIMSVYEVSAFVFEFAFGGNAKSAALAAAHGWKLGRSGYRPNGV
jgi:hypothetical protein